MAEQIERKFVQVIETQNKERSKELGIDKEKNEKEWPNSFNQNTNSRDGDALY